MSAVTTWMFTCNQVDQASLDVVGDWVTGRYGSPPRMLHWGDDGWGGNKPPQCLWTMAGAYNYFRLEEFLDFVRGLDWTVPGDVQIFVMGEHDTAFTVYELRDGQWAILADHRYPLNQPHVETVEGVVTDTDTLGWLRPALERYSGCIVRVTVEPLG